MSADIIIFTPKPRALSDSIINPEWWGERLGKVIKLGTPGFVDHLKVTHIPTPPIDRRPE